MQYLRADNPLPADPEHDLGENVVENESWVRCPYGCDVVWSKAHMVDFDRMSFHMNAHEMEEPDA